MTKVKDIIESIEQFAPPVWQEGWDNSGLQVGSMDDAVTGVVLTLDVTLGALNAAIERGANMVVSHHPLIFTGLKSVTQRSLTERIVYRAIRAGVAIYSCHTNMDSAPGGINTGLAQMLGLEQIRPLVGSSHDGVGMGSIGCFSVPLSLECVAGMLKQKLNLKMLRYSSCDNLSRTVSSVAFCGGSGGSLLEAAIGAGAELFITGDIKYGDFQRAYGQITLMDIGHWEGENHVIEIFYDIITKKIPTFANRITQFNSNHVNYYL